jgi:hypothetical protein
MNVWIKLNWLESAIAWFMDPIWQYRRVITLLAHLVSWCFIPCICAWIYIIMHNFRYFYCITLKSWTHEVDIQLEEPLHCWLNWGLYISAVFEGALKVALGPYTHCAWLSPCTRLDFLIVAFWSYAPMKLTDVNYAVIGEVAVLISIAFSAHYAALFLGRLRGCVKVDMSTL